MLKKSMERLLSQKGKAAILTKQQVGDLMAVAGRNTRNGTRNVGMLQMLFGAGMRVSEVAQLRVRDVLSVNGELMEECTLPASYTKTSKARKFYLVDSDTREALDRYIQHRLDRGQSVIHTGEYRGLNPKSNLFLAAGGRGYSLNVKKYKTQEGIKETRVAISLQNELSRIIKRIGVPGGSTHSGRRTFATRVYRRTGDIETAQFLLGHTNPDQTITYVEPDIKKIEEAHKNIFNFEGL